MWDDGWTWPQAKPGAPGCEEDAKEIQEHIGGTIEEIDPMADDKLGNSTNDPHGNWYHHQYVSKDGLAYDAYTGEEGLPQLEYQDQWAYKDALNFHGKPGK